MAALTEDDRDALVEGLATFTRADGRPFVSWPIVEPNRTYFPEPFEPSEGGLTTIAQRLLGYVGLERYRAEVALDEQAIDAAAMLPSTKTDLAGIEGRTVFFACTHLGRADDAALSLAHEVARAALVERSARALGGPYREMEITELIAPDDTDGECEEASIFATYLGLGLLSAAGSHHYRQAGRIQGRNTVTAWQHVSYGGLAPEATSFLLAVQLAVRAVDDTSRDHLLTQLSDERRAEVRSAMAELDRDELIVRLGLAPPSEWEPAATQPRAVTLDPPKRSKPKKRGAKRSVVFRVGSDRRVLGGALGGIATTLGALLVHGYFLPHDDVSFPVLCLGAGGLALGAWGGSTSRTDECSDCERHLPADATRCPHCAGEIGGRIARRDDRLEARESWRAAQRAKKNGP